MYGRVRYHRRVYNMYLVYACVCARHTGEVKRLKAYKPWAAEVAAAPRPTTDPLAPPGPPPAGGKKRGKKQGSSADDDLALVAAIKNKVRHRM